MKKLAVLFVIFVACSGFKIPHDDEEVFIRCQFTGSYTCNLFINNPDGIEFDEIEGNHTGVNTNDNVRLVQGLYQNSRNVPSILCESFPNLVEIFLEISNVEVLTTASFFACENIQMLYLGLNAIASIPDGVFATNRNLHTLMLMQNAIQEISINAFNGSQIAVLELDHNQLTEIRQEWVESIRETLEVFTISSNNITESPEGLQLENLRLLDISHNNLGVLQPDFFWGLTSLADLWIDDIGISSIFDGSFEGLTSLRSIRMSHNSLRQLPRNLFNNLNQLGLVDVSHNHLTELNLNTFNSSIATVFEIMADFNAISSVDSQIIEQSVSLIYLFLSSNLCVNRNFYGVINDREDVMMELSGCFTNFGFIECLYFEFAEDYYSCTMSIDNPTGRNSFDQITGTHEPNRTDENVVNVSAMLMNTLNVPSIICEQFPSLRDFSIRHSRIETVDEATFALCHNIRVINLEHNSIARIPDRMVAERLQLQVLNLNDNRISSIGASPFVAASSLTDIFLNSNQLTEFDAPVFNDVSETLTHLSMANNLLTSLPSQGFSNFSALRFLSLNVNQLQIPSDGLHGLDSLFYLNLGETGLTQLDVEWFNLPSLESLRLYSNALTEIPDGAFGNLPLLSNLDISTNQLSIISVDSFNESLNSLINLFLEGNRVNFVDPQLLNSPSLDYLFLSDNLCANLNFVDIQNNLESVRQSLDGCHTNFIGFARCSFYAPGFHYTCDLNTMNIHGRDFDEIEGNHHENQTNADVISITAVNQHTTTIPSILCSTFSNTVEMIFDSSHVEVISRSSFEHCTHLEVVSLSFNRISEIPDETFAGNPSLTHLTAFFNRIARVSSSAFTGTSLILVDLDYNEIAEYNRAAFDEVAGTLERLFLGHNLIGSLPDGAFSSLGQVEILNIANNPVGNPPVDAFNSMVNLATLIMHDCEIHELDALQFQGLNSLKDIRLAGNHLTNLPDGLFNQLWNLTEVDLDHNQLFTLPAAVFGTSVSTIRYVFAWFNNIFGIDALFFDNASELRWLFLGGNICSQRDFLDVLYNREGVRAAIDECLTNFDTAEEIHCNYIESDGDYFCMMSVFNPGGRMAFESVEGDHIGDRGDADVVEVLVINQNTRAMPEVICSQFENMFMLLVSNSRVHFLSASSFERCLNLEILLLNYNFIASIPDGTFSTTPRLSVIQIVSNQVADIGDSAFTGSALNFIDLSGNHIQEFNSRPFEGVNATLFSLLLPFNQISSLSEGSFANLRNLEILQLNYNPLNNRIPALIFASLFNLQQLTLINCGLTELNAQWFTGLSSLHSLHLSYNGFSDLPPNVFGSLYGIVLVNVASNNLQVIDGSAFGFLYSLIQSIYAFDNQIEAIDPRLLNEYAHLDTFMLNRNLCTDQDFVNITSDREVARSELEGCFSNFQPTLTCNFVDGDPFYECNLMIQNPAGVDNFLPIGGDHFHDRTDDDVGFVQIYRQNTANFPSIACRQFRNVEEIFIDSSNFGRLDGSTFSDCHNLWMIHISSNTIETLPGGVFDQNDNLELIYLRSNGIQRLSEGAFSGASLQRIFLDGNLLTSLDRSSFAGVNETLEYLDISFNRLQSLDENSFGELGNLEFLYLDGNDFTAIAENSFALLHRISFLALRDSGVSEFNPRWFSATSTLRMLHLDGNLIDSLPAGAFDGFSELSVVNLNRNQLTVLNVNSFGRALSTLNAVYAMNNQIDAIDARIIDGIEDLQNLFLLSNVCVNQNFMQVMSNLESVRSSLESCFNNFSENFL